MVGSISETAPLELRLDPRLKISTEDLQKQFDLERQISRRLTALHNTVNGLRDLRAEVKRLEQRYKNAAVWQRLAPLAEALLARIASIEDKVIQSKMKSTEGVLRYPTTIDEQLIYLNWSVDASDAAPTEGQEKLFAELSNQLQEQLNVWDQVLSRDVPAFNRAAESGKVQIVDVKVR
jgi:hypothetical protein